jgi:hypothetical protein
MRRIASDSKSIDFELYARRLTTDFVSDIRLTNRHKGAGCPVLVAKALMLTGFAWKPRQNHLIWNQKGIQDQVILLDLPGKSGRCCRVRYNWGRRISLAPLSYSCKFMELRTMKTERELLEAVARYSLENTGASQEQIDLLIHRLRTRLLGNIAGPIKLLTDEQYAEGFEQMKKEAAGFLRYLMTHDMGNLPNELRGENGQRTPESV